MRRLSSNIVPTKVDWFLIALYAALVLLGWLNIYAAVYDENLGLSIFSMDLNSGKQLMWIGLTTLIVLIMMYVDYNLFHTLAYLFFAVTIVLLIAVLFTRTISGANSWFQLGPIKFQPSELAKVATALAIARYINDFHVKFERFENYIVTFAIIGLPMLLIVLQPDPGTLLVFCSFMLPFYREGMNPTIIVVGLTAAAVFILTLLFGKIYLSIGVVVVGLLYIGMKVRSLKRGLVVAGGMLLIIGVSFSVDIVLNDVLKPHQRKRIEIMINPNADPLGDGWNVTQSKIAIGSGGLIGKGFLEGTQTKFDFVPEQSTDFIFCTIGEEHGWLGSLLLVTLFLALLYRIIYVAERQKFRFNRIYGYCVAGILFFHFMINVGMTIGLFPVIGIPLPFFSYGGSSLLSFTVLLFVFIKLDSHRSQMGLH